MARLRKPRYRSNVRKHGCLYSMSWLLVVFLSASEVELAHFTSLQLQYMMLSWSVIFLAHIIWGRYQMYRLLRQRRLQPLLALSDAERLALHQHLVDGHQDSALSSVRLVGDDGEFFDPIG